MKFDANNVQLNDEDDIESMQNAKQMLGQRSEMSDVSAYVADAPKEYPVEAPHSYDHADDDEDVQLSWTTHGSGSYVGQLKEEPDDVDYIKEGYG